MNLKIVYFVLETHCLGISDMFLVVLFIHKEFRLHFSSIVMTVQVFNELKLLKSNYNSLALNLLIL